MATREKNIWILIVFILSGLVIGGLLGQLASRSRVFMVVSLWTRIWAYKSTCTRFKHHKNNIWSSVKN